MGTRLRGTIGLAVLMALLALPAAAGAQGPSLTLSPDALLFTRTGNVLVYVPVRLTCEAPADATATLTLLIDQGIDPMTIAHGIGRRAVACSGTTRSYAVGVVAQNVPFREGGAAVRATLTICEALPRPTCTSEELGPQLLELVPTGAWALPPTP